METSENKNYTWIFFGTSDFSVIILDELKARSLLPKLIITTEDKPKGRKLLLTPPPVKVWAEQEGVPYLQLASLKDPSVLETIASYVPEGFDVSIVASYGKLIPQNILNMARRQTLNVHPSLLPKLRGASPIQSSILTENETGVTIMRLDAEMDHGPIVAQEHIALSDWPPYAHDLEGILGHAGGKLLADILPEWIQGNIAETEQDHTKATYCKKIEKSDGELDLSHSAEENMRKIRAYHVWPGAYFFYDYKDTKIRIIVKRARTENNILILERIIPEGKKEMSWDDFLKGLRG